MVDYNEYLLNFYFFTTKKLEEIIRNIEIGDVLERDIIRYILVSTLLKRLETYDPTENKQKYNLTFYVDIQNTLNIYLNTNITYYEFVYN